MPKLCSIDGCGRTAHSLGFCKKHYERQRIHGDPLHLTRHEHGKGPSRDTYVAWQNMMYRCFDPNNRAYSYYGERGITVCERWRVYRYFAEDMGDKPAGLT